MGSIAQQDRDSAAQADPGDETGFALGEVKGQETEPDGQGKGNEDEKDGEADCRAG